MHNSNNFGSTPSMDKMFGCFARMQTITSLQYLYVGDGESTRNPVVSGENPVPC